MNKLSSLISHPHLCTQKCDPNVPKSYLLAPNVYHWLKTYSELLIGQSLAIT